MTDSLKRISLLMFIACGIAYLSITIRTHLTAKQDDDARTVIINTIAEECKEFKTQQKAPDSFTASSLALEQILGNGIHNLDQDTYLRLLSLCYGSDVKTKSQKVFY